MNNKVAIITGVTGSVSYSFIKPIETLQFNIMATLNWLEAIKTTDKNARFYQASSSEMYGMVKGLTVTNDTALRPCMEIIVTLKLHWVGIILWIFIRYWTY